MPSATPHTDITNIPLHHMLLRILLTVAIVLAILIFLIIRLKKPEMNLDITFTALVVLATVPWLAPFVSSLKVGDLEFQFQKMQEQVDQNIKQTEKNTTQIRETTTEVTTAVLQPSGPGLIPSTDIGPSASPSLLTSPTETHRQYDELAREYAELRTLRSGLIRTAKMTAVANQMVDLIRRYGTETSGRSDWDPKASVPAYLDSELASDRLKGVCILYASPEFKFLSDLITALEREVAQTWGKSQHFLEYWEILAIGKVIDNRQISDRERQRLNKLLADPDIDDQYDRSRYDALSAILKST